MANDPLANHGGLLDQAEVNGITTTPAVTAVTPATSNGTNSTSSTAVTSVAPTTNTHSLFDKQLIQLNDQAGSPENKSTEGETKEEAGEEESEDISSSQLTIRALVSTKEAGVIIGKAGKNVAELRETTGVKAGVSKVVQGVHDRVLSVAGTLDGVAKAYSLIAQTLLENPVNASPTSTPITPPPNAFTSVRLLISHNLMGTIIGRQGLKIKHIQDVSGARMVASKEMLPQSTERVVEVQGTVEAIRVAVWEIGKCLIEDKERGIGTVLYTPAIRVTSNYLTSRRSEYTVRTGSGTDFTRPSRNGSSEYHRRSSNTNNNYDSSSIRTQNISIPADMVGCIIGKGGSKISEIRRLSGSRISIAKTPHDETGERMFTIQGTPEANEKALFLLYNQLENEKERRLNATANGDSDS
ncbi:Heterogeneous nuclear rnp K-like protein 2 [Gigaspora margarita]|uniref:Heterogeneous nuclear rnp K-like protein 2 n=1 Tax=Gigaspora margarita TaxID=4874 RepID=A0A8H4ASD8_GIGMA|nr:Heterogeneous nuclear rnp K-like protein 2 [Gigaspora margarita]